MCNWCDKETEEVPMVSGHIVPVICKECGGKIRYIDMDELRIIFKEWYELKRGN